MLLFVHISVNACLELIDIFLLMRDSTTAYKSADGGFMCDARAGEQGESGFYRVMAGEVDAGIGKLDVTVLQQPIHVHVIVNY